MYDDWTTRSVGERSQRCGDQVWPSHADAKLKYKIKISDQTRWRTYLASLVEEGHSKGHGVERYETMKLHVLPAVQNDQRRALFFRPPCPMVLQGINR